MQSGRSSRIKFAAKKYLRTEFNTVENSRENSTDSEHSENDSELENRMLASALTTGMLSGTSSKKKGGLETFRERVGPK
jgi:hypothetical protein